MGIFDRLHRKPAAPRAHRSNARVPIDLHAELRSESDCAVHRVFVRDLSSGGARITTAETFALNDRFVFSLRPRLGEKIEVACVVVSVGPRPGEIHIDYGLKFTAVRHGDPEAIKRFVTDQQRIQAAGAPAFSGSRVP